MKVETTTFELLTDQYNQFLCITPQVLEAVHKSGVKNGMVTVVTKHTTTGVAVNESLECLQSDMHEFLARLVPEDHPYAHARMLRDYGSTAGNPTGHLKAHLTGNHCHFAIADGTVVRGGAQEVFFCEFDGPSQRTVCVQVMGEE